jgi:hypothetical protein
MRNILVLVTMLWSPLMQYWEAAPEIPVVASGDMLEIRSEPPGVRTRAPLLALMAQPESDFRYAIYEMPDEEYLKPATATEFSGLAFDSDDYYTVATSASLQATTAFTVEMWFKPTASADVQWVILNTAISAWTEGPFVCLYKPNTQQLYFWVVDSTPSANPKYTSSSTLTPGIWSHIAYVYDGSYHNSYINGVNAGTPLARSTTMVANTEGIEIGVGSTYSAAALRMWNVARSEAELVANMNTVRLGPTSGLMLEHSALPGSGQTVTDESGNGNTGTLGADDGIGTDDPTWTEPYSTISVTDEAVSMTNADFETGDLSYWTLNGSPTTSEASAADKYAGTYSYSHAAAAENDGRLRSAAIAPGSYLLTAWAKCSVQSGSVRLMATWTDDEGSHSPQTALTANSTWTEYTIGFTAGEGASSALLCLYGAGTAYFDNVTLTRTKGPQP